MSLNIRYNNILAVLSQTLRFVCAKIIHNPLTEFYTHWFFGMTEQQQPKRPRITAATARITKELKPTRGQAIRNKRMIAKWKKLAKDKHRKNEE